MIVIGLTGSIGMGKTTAAGFLRARGVMVSDADAIVHTLMRAGGRAVPEIARAFPDVVHQGVIDRRRLGALVFSEPQALRRLEEILHPLVAARQRQFLRDAARSRRRVVALDVPLLFETGLDRFVDWTVVVTAPGRVQRARVLARRGMSEIIFHRVLARQMSDREKRRRADFVITTGLDKARSNRAIGAMLKRIRHRAHRRCRRQYGKGLLCAKSF